MHHQILYPGMLLSTYLPTLSENEGARENAMPNVIQQCLYNITQMYELTEQGW